MKINKEEMLAALLNNSAAGITEQTIESFSVPQLIEWSEQTADYRLAFRSAWYVEHFFLKKTAFFADYASEIIRIYCHTGNWSVLRSYSKLVMWMLSKQNDKITINEDQEECILEKSFNILDASDCPVAVQVNVMDILADLNKKHDWIANELRLRIELALEKDATPALKSRGNRILKRITNA